MNPTETAGSAWDSRYSVLKIKEIAANSDK
jgi:hypothetical protein